MTSRRLRFAISLGFISEFFQHPASGDAWRGLSNIKTVALADADAAALATQLQCRDIADSDRVAMGHALGKLEEALRERM